MKLEKKKITQHENILSKKIKEDVRHRLRDYTLIETYVKYGDINKRNNPVNYLIVEWLLKIEKISEVRIK